MKEEQIISFIKEDQWMMEILQTVKALNLPDWWICAGFVRSKVWDHLHGFTERTRIPDIDVIYFDSDNLDEKEEKEIEGILTQMKPNIPWSVKNEARMHLKNKLSPYNSSVDAISKFPETATAIGVKLDEQDNLVLAAPCGVSDLFHLEVKPTLFFLSNQELISIYKERIITKNWKLTWSKLKVFNGK